MNPARCTYPLPTPSRENQAELSLYLFNTSVFTFALIAVTNKINNTKREISKALNVPWIHVHFESDIHIGLIEIGP